MFIYYFLVIFFISPDVKARRYVFVTDNYEIFSNCKHDPNTNGIHDLLDLSKANFEVGPNSILISGDMKCAWKGVEPNDRVKLIIELFKFSRGYWQSTPFTIITMDFCKEQFMPKKYWYDNWTQYIPEEERLCVTNFGHIYHMQEYEFRLIFDLTIQVNGLHKIEFKAWAYDEDNKLRNTSICFEIEGYFNRI